MSVTDDIKEIVNRETEAWNSKNVNQLISIFHNDMVWPWPPTEKHHNPIDWGLVQGKFNAERWKQGWQQLFDTHDLIHNHRTIKRIQVSDQQDGAFAVVDIDTLWKNKKTGEEMNWKGRTCKTYSLTNEGWKMIHQVGVLDYSNM
ncbi:nuclear transport factor 2 family protein [Bdellovibrio sp. BCCA]|uniref:nuclear transport factor 2 family protein n=1 Tax=Bdellovibrio sp. BCCA TaxID=3136281 RepID=UPI0030EFC069